jgi:hypothetical protein
MALQGASYFYKNDCPAAPPTGVALICKGILDKTFYFFSAGPFKTAFSAKIN